jgi:hypothetical protein
MGVKFDKLDQIIQKLLALEIDFWRRSVKHLEKKMRNGYKNTILDDVWRKQLLWLGHL